MDESRITKLTLEIVNVFKNSDVQEYQEVLGVLLNAIFTFLPIVNPQYKNQLASAKALKQILHDVVIQLEFEEFTKS